MNYKKTKINDGIILHTINTEKFKTNLISIFLTSKLTREDITKKALILTLLRRGTKTMPTQEEISKALEDLYGANFDCGIDKIGDNHVLKFYVESVNENYLYKKEETLEKSIQILMEMVFNPLTKNGGFKEEYLAEEKENLKRLIEGKKDNKAQYSTQRCIEEMYKNQPYGLYKYGNIEELENLDRKTLYDYYKRLINNCRIDLIISGDNIENIEVPDIKSKKIEEIKSLSSEIEVIFIAYQKDYTDLEFLCKKNFFNYPIFYDKTNDMNKINNFPTSSLLQCFLIDQNNHIILIGNPIRNDNIWDLYKKAIHMNLSSKNIN